MNFGPENLTSGLSDSTRLRLVILLARHGELCVCELVRALHTHQPKVSRHLAVLRDNAIIKGRRDGQWIHYRLNPELPTWASNSIDALLQGCDSRTPFTEDELRLCAPDTSIVCGNT